MLDVKLSARWQLTMGRRMPLALTRCCESVDGRKRFIHISRAEPHPLYRVIAHRPMRFRFVKAYTEYQGAPS